MNKRRVIWGIVIGIILALIVGYLGYQALIV